MSKVTFALFIILCLFIGILLYVKLNPKPNTFITTLTQPKTATPSAPDTTVSFSTTEHYFQPGYTFTVVVIIHNSISQISLSQLELAYDPTELSVVSLTPGDFFTDPAVDLQHIDPSTGRISYALHCSSLQPTIPSNCTNQSSSTLAVITFQINSYSLKRTTTLSFLPKTVLRTRLGKNVLLETTNLQIPITNASASGVMPNAIHALPTH